GLIYNAARLINIEESRTLEYVRPATCRRYGSNSGKIHILKVCIRTLGPGSLICSREGGIVEIGLAKDITKMRIHGGDTSINASFSSEEARLVEAARLFFKYF